MLLKSCVFFIIQVNRLHICEKRKVLWHGDKKHNKYKIFVVLQWTITENLHWRILPEYRWFVSESTSASPRLADHRQLSVFQWLLVLGNSNLVSSLVVVDQKSKVMDFFDCCETVMFTNTTNEQIQYLWENQSSGTVYYKTRLK